MNERTVLRPSLARLANLGLSSTEAFVFTQIDGTSPLADVADLTGVPLDMVIEIARRLAELGAVDGEGVSGSLRLVPRRTARDIYAMKIEPSEAFLLSYVDGLLSVGELSEILGYDSAKAVRSVEALVAAGAVELAPATHGGRIARATQHSARGLGHASLRPPKVPRQPKGSQPPPERASIGPSKASVRPAKTKTSLRPPKTSATSATPPRVSLRPPKASLRPPKTSLRPAKVSLRPPKASLRPPKASLRPPKASLRPPKASLRPPKASLRPPKNSLRPPKASLRPPTASLRPPKASLRPPKNSLRPPKNSLPPPKASLRPPKFSLRPPKSSLRPPKASIAPPKPSVRPSTVSVRPAKAPPKVPSQRPVAAPPDDSTCDLDAEAIAKIDSALVGAAAHTHYAILGVQETASNKDLRRAYFALAATLHPDRYFRKKLGPYRKKLDDAFRRVTDSYDLLRSETNRAAYDATLGLLSRPRETSAVVITPAPPVAVAPARPVAVAPPARPVAVAPPATHVEITSPATHLAVAPPAAHVARTAPASPGGATAAKAPQADDRRGVHIHVPGPATGRGVVPSVGGERRASKAFKKPSAAQVAAAFSRPRTPGDVSPSSPSSTTAATKAAQMLETAQQALIAGDALGATNLYRLALQYAEDAPTRRYAESGLNDARTILAETYAKTARAAEKDAQWSAAVNAYGKALHLKPNDPEVCERLANALREEGQDLARATEVAELAVARAPRRAAYKKTLGRIHAASGLRAKALEQLEGAFAIEPDDATARLIAVLKKQSRG